MHFERMDQPNHLLEVIVLLLRLSRLSSHNPMLPAVATMSRSHTMPESVGRSWHISDVTHRRRHLSLHAGRLVLPGHAGQD